MSERVPTVQYPLGFILFVVFLVLKLTDHIDWSWVWITAPLWIPLGLSLVLLAVAGIIWAVCK
jgi:inner membrane protein involved in colicin E2 resistance